ncbi:MAG: ABC transporter permease [Pseudomonadota bacterium]|nr:ABC transporter permease [Pseudomonadota bacterium]
MSDLWQSLSPMAQDILWALLLLLPSAALGAFILRGYAPWPLVRAILWRFRWSSALFVILIAVSVGMGIGLLAQERGLRRGSAQAADKFDLVVAAPGSELTVMFATVYLQASDMPLLSGAVYNEIANHEHVSIAAPIAFGDSFEGAPVIGTTAEFARYLTDDQIEGRLWQTDMEAVAGALVPLEIGAAFTPAHGTGDAAEHDAHDGANLEIVGHMAPTGTPWDRAILLPIEAIWDVHGLANGHAPYTDEESELKHVDQDEGTRLGPPFDADYFPGTPAIVVHADELWANYALRSEFTRGAETMAFFPGAVLSRLYRVMGDIRQAMSLMALLTQVLVASSVLLGLFILSQLFRRQIGLLRALGAPARFAFAVVWSFGTTLLLTGATLGLVTGLGAAAILSRIVTARTDVVVHAALGWSEIHFLAAFVSVTLLMSLLPAALMLRMPVVSSLRA